MYALHPLGLANIPKHSNLMTICKEIDPVAGNKLDTGIYGCKLEFGTSAPNGQRWILVKIRGARIA